MEAQSVSHWPRPYRLALDEMNLARVECSFARFLSTMGVRARGREVFIEPGPGERVPLGPNMFFVGTISVDETTHGFADKVYDRAQLDPAGGVPRGAAGTSGGRAVSGNSYSHLGCDTGSGSLQFPNHGKY